MTTFLYLLIKYAHVVSAVLFLGNVLLAPHRRRQARTSGNLQFIAGTYDAHVKSGKTFTLPWLAATVLTGLALSGFSGYGLLHTGWLLLSVLLTVAATAVFALRLAPLQRAAADAAMSLVANNDDEGREHFQILTRRLESLGRLVGAMLYSILALMVFKPPLPLPW